MVCSMTTNAAVYDQGVVLRMVCSMTTNAAVYDQGVAL